jgi:hypothetical protein
VRDRVLRRGPHVITDVDGYLLDPQARLGRVDEHLAVDRQLVRIELEDRSRFHQEGSEPTLRIRHLHVSVESQPRELVENKLAESAVARCLLPPLHPNNGCR